MESENFKEVDVIVEGTEPEELACLILGETRVQDMLLPSIEEEDNKSEEYDSATETNNLEEAADYLPLAQQPAQQPASSADWDAAESP